MNRSSRPAPPYLSDEEVRSYLGSTDILPALKAVVLQVAAGAIVSMPRAAFGHGPLGEVTHLMAAMDHGNRRMVTKLVDYDPTRPHRTGRPSIVGLVTYAVAGEVVYLASAGTFTNIRTAAATALAVDLMTRPEADVLTIFGAGPLAREEAIAIARCRKLREIRIVSRSGVTADHLARELSGSLAISVRSLTAASPRQACRGADIVVTVTSAVDPFLVAGDVQPGTLVAAVGSGTRDRRELAGNLVGSAKSIVVETLEVAQSEAGDLISAAIEGYLDFSTVLTLADILRSDYQPLVSEIAIYKSVGAAWEDLACANIVAQQLGATTHEPQSR